MGTIRHCAIGLALSANLFAQTYQSSFAEVKYDRARTPVTLHGGAGVDLPSGAVAYSVPLGPGIGARGVRYLPTLNTRFGPQVPPPNPYSGSNQVHPGGISCTLTPGYFVLSAGAPVHGSGLPVDDEYLLPDGTAGSGVSLAGPSQTPVGIDTTGIAQAFGITGAVATVRGIGHRGELILSLSGDAYPSRNIYLWEPTLTYPNPAPGSPSGVAETFLSPGGIMVVSPDGETATVFVLVNAQFTSPKTLDPPWPIAARSAARAPGEDPNPNDLLAVHYLPSLILNRFGERITFEHLAGVTTYGVDFDATWSSRGGGSNTVKVRVVGSAEGGAPNGWINGGGVAASSIRVRVTYSESNVSSYTVDAFGYGLWNPTSLDHWGVGLGGAWDRYRRNLQPTQVTVDATGEKVKFAYQASSTDGSTGLMVPVTLQALELPSRRVTFTWSPYRYRRPTGGTVFSEYGLMAEGYTDIASASGVVRVDDQDLTGNGPTRTTTYTRTVPTPDLTVPTGPYWTSTTFKVGVRHPDGRATLTRFAEPLANVVFNANTWNDAAKVFQAMAYLKHLPVEVREYAKGVDFSADGQEGNGGSAYRGVLYGPPAGQGRFAVGSFDNEFWSSKQVGNPAGTLGSRPYAIRTETWGPEGTRVETRSSWDSANYGWQTSRLDASTAADSKSLTSTFTFESHPASWHMGMVKTELRPGHPLQTRVYNGNYTLDAIQASASGAATVETKFDYADGWPMPKTVALNGAYKLSGLLGARYGFDSFGYINSIVPAKDPAITWNIGQTQDSLGRPTSQTDPHGVCTTFDYTTAGRLHGIYPPFPESGTTVDYDPDNLGATISRGSQSTHLRYNGFGELISETRTTPNGPKSRTFGYDLAGKLASETVWGSAASTVWTFNEQGRLWTVTDPNGVVTTTTYNGASRTVTVGGAGGRSTVFVYDCLGRLGSVTDALNQSTTYSYDDAGRILSATQTASQMGSLTQTRRWTYTLQGWLQSLVQPESGTTVYGDFTVGGKPTLTTYGAGSAAPRSVAATPDSLGRITALSASDGSVTQTFRYDKARIEISMDSNVRLTHVYGGLNGRLSGLTTTLWNTGPATESGNGDFLSQQGFTYNNDGLRNSAAVDGRRQDFSYFEEIGLPKQVNYTGAGLNNSVLALVTATSPSGLPIDLTLANGAGSHFDYRADGVGLGGIRHSLPGGATRAWTYTYPTSGALAGLLTGDGEDSYDYDALGRLKTATVKVPGYAQPLIQRFEFDPFGNPTASSTENLSQLPRALQDRIPNFRFNEADYASNRLPKMTAGTGAAGNLVPPADTGALFDDQGNLTQLFKLVGAPDKSVNLTYDALGRVLQLVDNESGLTERYFYTPEGLRTRIETHLGTAPENLVLQKVQHRIYNDQRQLVSLYEAVAQ